MRDGDDAMIIIFFAHAPDVTGDVIALDAIVCIRLFAFNN
jgi:hypothetical protein